MNNKGCIFSIIQAVVMVCIFATAIFLIIGGGLWAEGFRFSTFFSRFAQPQSSQAIQEGSITSIPSATPTVSVTFTAVVANLPDPVAVLQTATPELTPTPTVELVQPTDTVVATLVLPTATLTPTATATPIVYPTPVVTMPPQLAPGSALPERLATRIVISSLEVDTSVLLAPIKDRTWQVDHLDQDVGHLEGTASPGSNSNVVLAAHVTLAPDGRAGPFKYIRNLAPGDIVTVYDNEQAYHYEIDYLTSVKPTEIAVTYPSDEAKLTLITCLNYDSSLGRYTDRLVAVGHLVSN